MNLFRTIYQKIKTHRLLVENTAYLSVIEVVRLILPLVALPYVIRVIGGENYGKVAFAQTIISYFVVFINWGLDISAVKDISIHRANKKALNQIVSTVLSLKLFLFAVSFLVLSGLLAAVPFLGNEKWLYYATFLTCLSELLFPVWYYQGIEKMKYITIIRFTSILFYAISVFIFVRHEDHYVRVAFLQSFGNVIAGVISIYLLFKVEKVRLLKVSFLQLKIAFVESVPFFMSRVSNVVNLGAAKLISGTFFSMHLVAAFDLAQKISNFAIVPIQMLNQAVFPKLAKERSQVFANKFFYLNICVSFVVAVGVFLVAPYAIRYFAADDLSESVLLLRILCMYIFFGGITTYIGSPVLVSFGYPKPFNRSVLLSTLILLIMYLGLYLTQNLDIRMFALTLAMSELAILIYRLYFCYKYRIFVLPWAKK